MESRFLIRVQLFARDSLDAIKSVDLNGNGIPDVEEPIILDLAWQGLLRVSRRYFRGTRFHHGLEVAEQFRQVLTGQDSGEVAP